MLTLSPGVRCCWGERHVRAQPAPEAPCGEAVRGKGAWEGPTAGDPLHSLFGPPGAAGTGGQEVIVQQGGHPGDPCTGASRLTRTCTHTHAHAHTHTEVVRPSVLARSRAWAAGPQWSTGWAGVRSHIRRARPAGWQPSRLWAPTVGWGRGQELVGKHRVVPRGTGAGGILAARRVLLEGH